VKQPPSRRGEFWAGVKATIPLIIGAMPFGIIFGALAVTSGLTPMGSAAMSMLVFAGSAQFIAAGLVASGVSTLVIVLTTLVVNLRHMLYAVSLAPHMKHLPQRWLAPLAFWLTDESYVVVIEHYQRANGSPYKHWFFLGSALSMYFNWQLCTWIGIEAGQVLPNPQRWGLDFALVATFIGLLASAMRNRSLLAAALTAGGAAALFHSLPHQLWLILAALLGVIVGVATDHLTAKAEESKMKGKVNRIKDEHPTSLHA
jgi:4-azaleucine resistance transporter AzlC